jgi:hypothetical protein
MENSEARVPAESDHGRDKGRMKLDLRFSERPLEDLWCEAVVALVFQRKFLTMGALAGLDGKLGGLLGRLEEGEIWTGAEGENLLVASQGMIKAEKILLCGLGPAPDCDPACLAGRVEQAGVALLKMHVQDFGIHIPAMEGRESEYPSHLETAVHHLVSPYLRAYCKNAEFRLKVVFSLERFLTGPMLPAVESIREGFGPEVEVSVVLERERKNAINT